MRNNDIAQKRGRFNTCAGSPIHVLYSPKLMEDGTIQLIECGTENTDEIIQSYYESTTLESILTRFANGDLSALNRYQPIYADVSTGPKNLAEAMQLLIDAEKAFNALPADTKNQFDNNFRQWILKANTQKWFDTMKPFMGITEKEEVKAVAPDPAAE